MHYVLLIPINSRGRAGPVSRTGGFGRLQTGAWTAGARDGLRKSPDKMSRASPVFMVGYKQGGGVK